MGGGGGGGGDSHTFGMTNSSLITMKSASEHGGDEKSSSVNENRPPFLLCSAREKMGTERSMGHERTNTCCSCWAVVLFCFSFSWLIGFARLIVGRRSRLSCRVFFGVAVVA